MKKRRCPYCRYEFEEGDSRYKGLWCSESCYRNDLDRYLEDKRDGERDEHAFAKA